MRPRRYPTATAPATVAIGLARIVEQAASVNLTWAAFTCSGMAAAQSAAAVAESAALFTALWVASLTLFTCEVAVSAILSVALCADIAISSILLAAGPGDEFEGKVLPLAVFISGAFTWVIWGNAVTSYLGWRPVQIGQF